MKAIVEIPDTDPEWLTRQDIGKLTRRDPRSIDRWRREEPDFPVPVLLGRKLIWKRDEILAWLESHRASKPAKSA